MWKKKRQLLSHSLSFFLSPLFISSSLDTNLISRRRAARRKAKPFGSAHLAASSFKRLPPVLPVFPQVRSPGCCCGWWSVLSPSPPRWSNWKRKVPLLWTHVQGAMSVRQAMSYEQLINNYCFCGLPQGRSYNLQQEEDVKWVCSRDCCIRSRFFFLMTRYWGVFALLVNPNSVTMMYEAWLSY